MEAVREGDPALATQCLDLCQALISKGLAFSPSLSVGSTTTFTLDTREKKEVPSRRSPPARKKPSPSTLRRNARRKEEFLKKKNQPSDPPASPPAAPGSWRSSPPTNTSRVGVKLTRRPKSGIPQHDGLDDVSENSETEANEKEKTSESQMTEDLSEVLKYLEQRRHMEEEDRVKKREERRKYREHHNLPA